MDTNSSNDLENLKDALRSVFAVFSQKIPGISFEFLNATNLDFKNPDYEPIGVGVVHVGREGTTPLRIERDDKGDFRLSILSQNGEGFSDCSHILHVSKEDVGSPNKWRVDEEAVLGSHYGRRYREHVDHKRLYHRFLKDNIYAQVGFTCGLLFDAILPLFQESITKAIVEKLESKDAVSPASPALRRRMQPRGAARRFRRVAGHGCG